MRVKKIYVVFCVLLLLVPYLTYIPSTDKVGAEGVWEHLTNVPNISANDPNITVFGQSILNDGRVFITGGEGPSSKTYFYDPTANTWTQGKDLPVPLRSHAQSTLSDGRVLVTGGFISGDEWGGVETNKTYIYNPVNNTWSMGADFPAGDNVGRSQFTLNDGKVLVGGRSCLYIYNPTTNIWSTQAVPSNYVVGDAQSSKLLDGRIFFTGGHATSNYITNETFFYNPSNNTWSKGPDVPTTLSFHSQTTLSNGEVMVLGGVNNSIEDLNKTFIYNPTTNVWREGPPLPPSKRGDWRVIQSSGLQDGRIFIGLYGDFYIYDENAKPTVTNVTPTGNYTTNNRTVNVSWLFNDPDPGDIQGKYQVVGSLDNFATWQFDSGEKAGTASSYSATVPSDGKWNFAVRVADQKGKWSDWTYINNITIDSTAPTISGVSAPLYAKENFNVDITIIYFFLLFLNLIYCFFIKKQKL